MVGVIEDIGLFKGLIKLFGAGGGTLVKLVLLDGTEKSSISLFKIIPVLSDNICDPKYELMVEVIDTAFLSLSTTHMWLVPCSLMIFHLKGVRSILT
jgi:hypothetical protein